MKGYIFIFAFAMCLTTTSCISTSSSTRISKVEVGMNKSDIQKLLGKPEFKNGDLEGEQWGYHKMIGEIAGPDEILFLVTFDRDGKVIAYNSVKEHRLGRFHQ